MQTINNNTLNIKKYATGRTFEDIQNVEGVAKGIITAWKTSVPIKPNAQSTKETIPHFQELAIYTKEKKKS